MLRRKCTEIMDEYAKTILPEIRYSGITSALAKVSISHGKARREALRELDRVVTCPGAYTHLTLPTFFRCGVVLGSLVGVRE